MQTEFIPAGLPVSGIQSALLPIPISSARVLVTRASQQGSELADRLRALGAEPILIPAIETADPRSFAAIDDALAGLNAFHWLLFTSANAVEAFAKRLLQTTKDATPTVPEALQAATGRVPHLRDSLIVAKVGEAPQGFREDPQIAAIGPATARALEKIGRAPTLVPPQAVAESLAEALLPHALQPDGTPTRFLLLRAEEAREHLPETLRAAGAEVTVAPAYRTVIPEGSVPLLREIFAETARHPDAITFTSSSTARNLLALCEAARVILPATILRVSIGPITSRTLHELGFPADAEAPEATVSALAETVMKSLRIRSGRST